MEVRKWENVDVSYIPSSGVLQIWSDEEDKQTCIGLFYVNEED